MRQASILFKGERAGILSQLDDGSFTFQYDRSWANDSNKPPISLTLPKTEKPYHADYLFPFFYNLLPEGTNKQVICRVNRIDRGDHFGLLTVTAKNDTIGAVRVLEIDTR